MDTKTPDIDKIFSQGDELSEDSKTITGDLIPLLLNLLTTQSLPIEAQLDSSVRDYHTILRFVSGSDDLDGLYMLIDALDPSVGNIKIRSSSDVTLKVFHEKYLIEIVVYFVGVVPRQQLIRLTLPSSISLMKQKRGKYRVRVEEKWKVKCDFVRPSGLKVPCKILDISAGGFSFESLKDSPKLNPNAKIKCQITSAETKDINVRAKVLSCDLTKSMYLKGRCRFLFENAKDEQQVNGMVAAFQRLKLQKRMKYSSFRDSKITKG